jgi:hypothetical protein
MFKMELGKKKKGNFEIAFSSWVIYVNSSL